MKISNLYVVIMAVILTVFVAASTEAQQSRKDRLIDVNTQIGKLLTQMEESSKEYPKVIKDLRKHRVGLEKAAETVQKMIDDLKKTTEKMDVNSEYYSELNAFKKEVSSLISEVKAKGKPEFVKTLDEQLQELQGIERRRQAAVVQARNIIRELEDNQDDLVLIIKIGNIEAAIEIFQRSLGKFESIIDTAKNVQERMVTAISTP